MANEPAFAQSSWWPWASEPAPSRRPPPVRREEPPDWRTERAPNTVSPGARSNVCLQLEQRLVDEQRRGSSPRDDLPQIEGQLRQAERTLRSSERALDRADCYDQFLFSRTLRRSRQCIELANNVESSRRAAAELDAQRRQILGSGARERSLQDDLIRELARNNCGQQYAREAARRSNSNNPFSSLWQDEDTGPTGRGNDFRSLPFATYRTVCVRLCDGYFFPISFSTLESHFNRDLEACQSKCAAPVDLYYYQNPGGTLDQAASVTSRQPYKSLRSAFRYRKEYVQGCSCKVTEYTPSPADKGERRTDTGPQSPTRQAQRPAP